MLIAFGVFIFRHFPLDANYFVYWTKTIYVYFFRFKPQLLVCNVTDIVEWLDLNGKRRDTNTKAEICWTYFIFFKLEDMLALICMNASALWSNLRILHCTAVYDGILFLLLAEQHVYIYIYNMFIVHFQVQIESVIFALGKS